MFVDDVACVIDIISIISNPPVHEVRALAAIERIVSGVAPQLVDDDISDDEIVTGPAFDILDQGSQILLACNGIHIEIRIRDIAGNDRRGVPSGEQRPEGAPLAGPKVDLQIGREQAQIKSIFASTIPQSREYERIARPALLGTVNALYAGHLIPSVSGITGIGVEIGTIHILHCADIIDANCLKIFFVSSISSHEIWAIVHDCIV